MSAGNGYQVSPQALTKTAQGINEAIAALKNLGVQGTADAGRGFADLSLSGMQVGHPGAQAAFASYLSRETWVVRALVQSGDEIAMVLGLNAGAYADVENYSTGVFKDVYADALGNPQTPDSVIETEPWSTVRADNPITDVTAPDYTSTSAAEARKDIAATWDAEGRDVFNGVDGLNQAIAQHDGAGAQFTHLENDLFGAAPTGSTAPAAQPPAGGGG